MRYTWRGIRAFRDRPTHYERRSLPTAVIPLFVAVAVLGYVAGHAHSESGAGEAARTARSGHVLIEYPAGWRPVSGGASIPGLAIASPRLIVAGTTAARAGLVVGTLPAGEVGPLPRSFVASLRRSPETAVVELVEGQAYRFAGLSVPGLQATLTVFVIPNPGGHPTALACYAPTQASPYMRACEQSVSGVTVVDQSQIYQLTPEPGYGAKIGTAISSLDRLRVSLKRELHPQVTVARAQELATRLGDGYASAVASLARLEPSSAAAEVQKALTKAIERARDGYRALAVAVGERSASGYTAAQKRVSEAESDVDWALENFVLIGYSPTPSVAAKSSP